MFMNNKAIRVGRVGRVWSDSERNRETVWLPTIQTRNMGSQQTVYRRLRLTSHSALRQCSVRADSGLGTHNCQSRHWSQSEPIIWVPESLLSSKVLHFFPINYLSNIQNLFHSKLRSNDSIDKTLENFKQTFGSTKVWFRFVPLATTCHWLSGRTALVWHTLYIPNIVHTLYNVVTVYYTFQTLAFYRLIYCSRYLFNYW